MGILEMRHISHVREEDIQDRLMNVQLLFLLITSIQ